MSVQMFAANREVVDDIKHKIPTVSIKEIATEPETIADTEYKLYRGGRETIRLTAQHQCLVDRQGWLLHPKIAEWIANIPRPQIADVATGTGIWALQLAEAMPEADIYGLDISDKQYPPSWTCPKNTHFDTADILEDVPAHYRGKFDVVHVRLLLGAGPDVDREIFINHFRSLLKPGGWLQWDELAWPNMFLVVPPERRGDDVRTQDTTEHPAVRAMTKHINMGNKLGWTHQFRQVLKESGGFTNIQHEHAPCVPRLFKIETDLNVAVVTDLLDLMLASGKVKTEADKLEVANAIEQLQQDQRDGLLFTYNWTNNIAQKINA